MGGNYDPVPFWHTVPRQPRSLRFPSKLPGDVKTVDLELAARCRAGDAEAFEELYRQHARRLFSLVFRMTGSAEDAEDLLQEVFLQAHRKLAAFRGESTLGTWLYRLTMNHCLDHLRGRHARMSRSTESLDREDAFEPAERAPS